MVKLVLVSQPPITGGGFPRFVKISLLLFDILPFCWINNRWLSNPLKYLLTPTINTITYFLGTMAGYWPKKQDYPWQSNPNHSFTWISLIQPKGSLRALTTRLQLMQISLRMKCEFLTCDLRASNWGLTKVTNVASSFITFTTAGITWFQNK